MAPWLEYLILLAAGVIAGALNVIAGGGSTAQIIGAVGGFGLNTVFLTFGRNAEKQADVVGAQTLAKAGYDPLAMADFFETLRELSGRDPGRFETFFSSHPAPGNRARRIEEEGELLGAIRKTAPVGSFSLIKSRLDRLPDAPSMQELAGKESGSPPDSGSSKDPPRPALARIEAPSAELQLFQQQDGFFRIRYPSNWRSYESKGDWSTILAPAGGIREGGDGEDQIVYGILIGHFDPSAGDRSGRGQLAIQRKWRAGTLGQPPDPLFDRGKRLSSIGVTIDPQTPGGRLAGPFRGAVRPFSRDRRGRTSGCCPQTPSQQRTRVSGVCLAGKAIFGDSTDS